ncbi:hypothetical protein ACH9L7_06100 [Haloferax sp. S1W]|uniref:hypothetical protein n=1 Tax=Haloferax sp. S1W TaxID=3377110 RepID=UPI0037CBBC66
MEETRRSFLQTSGITAGTLLVAGFGSQHTAAAKPESKSRLRGTLSNPIPAAKVKREKNRLINARLEERGVDTVPTVGLQDMPDDHHIVAFNFDIIDGTPSGWVGVVADPAKGRHQPDSLDEVRRGRVSTVHQKAKHNAKARSRRREQAHSTNTDDVTTQTTDDWSDWNTQVSERHEIVGSDGNETGYDIKWKSDPSNYSNHAVETEVRMLPQPTDWVTEDWVNEWADPLLTFNGSCIDEVSDYGPGNSIGSITNTISLSVSSDDVVEVGASQSNTSSNVDIDNHSDTYGGDNYVNQKFTISGDLQWNTVRVNQSASTAGTTYSSGDKYCDMDLVAKYRWGTSINTHKHTYNFNVFWA